MQEAEIAAGTVRERSFRAFLAGGGASRVSNLELDVVSCAVCSLSPLARALAAIAAETNMRPAPARVLCMSCLCCRPACMSSTEPERCRAVSVAARELPVAPPQL